MTKLNGRQLAGSSRLISVLQLGHIVLSSMTISLSCFHSNFNFSSSTFSIPSMSFIKKSWLSWTLIFWNSEAPSTTGASCFRRVLTDWPGLGWDLAKCRMVKRRGWILSGSWEKNLVRAGVKSALRAVFSEHCLLLKFSSISNGRPAWMDMSWIVGIAPFCLLN